ncbi:MAG: hypothetical protein R3C44_16065 [Chloroflexota bacterium]
MNGKLESYISLGLIIWKEDLPVGLSSIQSAAWSGGMNEKTFNRFSSCWSSVHMQNHLSGTRRFGRHAGNRLGENTSSALGKGRDQLMTGGASGVNA